ncbi:MAG: hypothetical protein ACREU0_09050 [Burkholderiales bacterium]
MTLHRCYLYFTALLLASSQALAIEQAQDPTPPSINGSKARTA